MHSCYARLAGLLICASALVTSAAANADTLTYTTPGAQIVTLPLGVASIHVVAVGGRGGGLAGGYGAVVSGDIPVIPITGATVAPQIRVTVAGNGGIGTAGIGGGGTGGFVGGNGVPPLPTLAGGGGGASVVETCRFSSTIPCVFNDVLTAGGGGGAGGDGLPGTGGAGGSAGMAAVAGSAGSAAGTMTAAGGGAPGEASGGIGGAGSRSFDPACEDGDDGRAGRSAGSGGAGGLSADLAGHGDAGGGGGGYRGGGGGGGGSYCDGVNAGTSGGGGGAGASRGPAGGQIVTDASGQPSVTLSYALSVPTISLTAPTDGAVYENEQRVRAAYRCSPGAGLRTTIRSCIGSVATRSPLDLTLGEHEFTVTATDSIGLTAATTVHYRVVDKTAPRIARVRISPRTIDATRADAYATVSFRLDEPARVRVGIHRMRGHAAHAARRHARIIVADAGRNSFRLRARIDRRVLRLGAYRLTLVAVDPSGNRSRVAGRRFVVDG